MNSSNSISPDATWSPSSFGKAITGAPTWRLSLNGDTYLLEVAEKRRTGSILELQDLKVVRGVFWSCLKLVAPTGLLQLDGIPNANGRALLTRLQSAIDLKRSELAADEALSAISTRLISWAASHQLALEHERSARGWLSKEFVDSQVSGRPTDVASALGVNRVRERAALSGEDLKQALILWDRDFSKFAKDSNDQHLQAERVACADFFRKVEKTPLTQEQIDAVVCLDSRVLLVAAAGSGKTSTMVAKAGYAMHKGYFLPESILLLAFNNAAAAELRERITARLAPIGLPATQVIAKTFHSFGLDVIGQATGKRPSIAPWLESGGEMDALMSMVDRLKDRSAAFRVQWDMFRVVFGQDLPAFGKEEEGQDSFDRETQREGFWTLNGETVRSRGEQLIANWLFYNGVEYEYERPYEHSTATSSHRQYNPDF